jgi:3-hydroxybutyryl-CoA dehydrogenase
VSVEKVGVVGGGLMGSGIAEVCSKAGIDVIVHEIDTQVAEAALGRIQKSLGRAVERSKLDEAGSAEILSRISVTTDLEEMADRQLVIEAVTENEDLKKEILGRLDDIVTDETAILASNTSSIPITRLATSTNRPSHVVGMHFFSPVPVMALMELVTTVMSDSDVEDRAQAFAERIGKTVIRAKDRAGFIVNMLLIPYWLAAIRMYEAGVASKEDIDTGMKLGANHPMGPLELADFVGLDVTKFVADVLFDEYKEPMYSSPPLLTRMVEAGLLGRKTGRGFYTYE